MAYHNLLFGEQKTVVQRRKSTKKHAKDGRSGEAAGPDKSAGSESALSKQPPAGAGQHLSASPMDPSMRYGSGEARLVEWGILDGSGQRCQVIESGKACRMYMVLDCEQDIEDLSCGFNIKDRRGTVLWGVTNLTQKQPPYKARAGSRLTIAADCIMWLSAGDYFVTLGAAHLEDGAKIDFAEDAIGFKVIGPEGIFTTSTVNLQTAFSIERKAREVRSTAEA